MPARKRPTPEDTATARRVLLDGLARDADIFEVVSELAPLHPRDNTFPGEVFLRLAADALDWCRATRSDPLPLEGLRERFLPERAFRGSAKLEVPVRGAGRGSHPRRDRTGPAGGGRLVAGRRLLAVRAVRGGRLHPRRGQPGGRAGAPGVPGPGPALWPPSAITTSSGHSPAGPLRVGRPIMTVVRVCPGIAVRHRRVLIGSSAAGALSGGRDRPAELFQPVPVYGQRPRHKRRRYR